MYLLCIIFLIVFGMLLGDTLILEDLDSANAYRQEVDTIYMYYVTTHRLCSKLCLLELICMYEGLVMMPIGTCMSCNP